MGKAHQTSPTCPLRESSHAAGRRTTSCRIMDTSILSTPLPRAWKVAETTTENPAKRKLRLIIRRAGTPMASISSEALKSWRMGTVANWSTSRQATIYPTASTAANFTVWISRFFLRAPRL